MHVCVCVFSGAREASQSFPAQACGFVVAGHVAFVALPMPVSWPHSHGDWCEVTAGSSRKLHKYTLCFSISPLATHDLLVKKRERRQPLLAL